MRALLAFAALALGSLRGSAQARPAHPATPAPTTAPGAKAQTPSTPAPAAQDTAAKAAVSQEVQRQRAAGETYLPDADVFTMGDRSIAANTVVDGPIAVARGNLDVYGTVNGNAFALDGDVRVHKDGRITGDAWAVSGSVIVQGGTIEGQKRSVAVTPPAIPNVSQLHPREPLSTLQFAKLVGAWFALLVIIGIGVMVFAESNLEGVVTALERGFARSFWFGLAGQVAFLPALLVLVAGLAITVLGVLLIPFAIVAYVIAVAGLVTLGFLAVARLTGGALASDRGTTSPRGVHLRALVIGLVAYLGIWMVAALFAWNPVIGAVCRAIAIAITWVAATLGLGAALASRAGTHRAVAGTAQTGTDDYAWQTPTPVTGVAAATRKVKVAGS
jgi:hypothetical protein